MASCTPCGVKAAVVGVESKTAGSETHVRVVLSQLEQPERTVVIPEVLLEVLLDVSLIRIPLFAFDPARGSLGGYLRVLVHGISLDFVRRNTSRSQRDDREHRETADPEDAQLDPLEHLLNQELSGRVSEALLSLRDEERQPIVAAFFGQMTYREIAARTGIPEGTNNHEFVRACRSCASSSTTSVLFGTGLPRSRLG